MGPALSAGGAGAFAGSSGWPGGRVPIASVLVASLLLMVCSTDDLRSEGGDRLDVPVAELLPVLSAHVEEGAYDRGDIQGSDDHCRGGITKSESESSDGKGR